MKKPRLRVVRVMSEDLEPVLERLPRTAERTKSWMRQHFVYGRSAVDIAKQYKGTTPQQVANSIRAVAAKLEDNAFPLQYVQITISLPLLLGQELQELVNELADRGSKEFALSALAPVLSAIRHAKMKI